MNRLSRTPFRLIFALALFSIGFDASAKPHKEEVELPRPLSDSDFYDNNSPSEDMAILGNLLFYDKVLSGNMNISCATCHHSLADLGDGLSLPIGEGGMGLGMTRDTGGDTVRERVPRNAPPVFSMGAKDFDVIFHDGRIQKDEEFPSGIKSPAGEDLPDGLDNVLAAQAMFPVKSGTEMAGQVGENSIADAAADGNLAGEGGVWEQLANRLSELPEYVELFKKAFDDIENGSPITFTHAANAIAAFEASTWTADNNRFDQFLKGDGSALSLSELRGMKLFYGKAKCASCHSGPLYSDFVFHAIAMPQLGPGKGSGESGREDFGRELVTGNVEDRYKFRTPPLRNIALTAPYGHSGAYNTLEGVVRHHLDPVHSINNYDRINFIVPPRGDLDNIDFLVMEQPEIVDAIADASELKKNRRVSETDIRDLVGFLKALTDESSIDLRIDIPSSVPSGLPIFD